MQGKNLGVAYGRAWPDEDLEAIILVCSRLNGLGVERQVKCEVRSKQAQYDKRHQQYQSL